MKRISDPSLSPPTRIELPGGRIWPRAVLVVVLIAVAAGAFAYGIQALLQQDPGWQQIEAVSPQTAATQELTLRYLVKTQEEQRTLPSIYTQAADRAYKIFSGELYDGIQGIGYLNGHPGETVTVEPELYHALELLESSGSRYLCYAPVYERYRGIYSCQEDSETEYFDPALSQETASYLEQARTFAGNPSAVKVMLLGDNQVKLTVSQAYREFARENEIGDYLDFFWLRNAFTVDAVADALTAAGYTGGVLSSFEGFSRVLGEGSYAFTLYTRQGDSIVQAALLDYTGPKSVVTFREFPLNPTDQAYYYVRSDGTVRTPYIGEADSLCHGTVPSLAAFDRELGCAELALALLPVYTADVLDETALADFSAVWAGEDGVRTTGTDAAIRKP